MQVLFSATELLTVVPSLPLAGSDAGVLSLTSMMADRATQIKPEYAPYVRIRFHTTCAASCKPMSPFAASAFASAKNSTCFKQWSRTVTQPNPDTAVHVQKAQCIFLYLHLMACLITGWPCAGCSLWRLGSKSCSWKSTRLLRSALGPHRVGGAWGGMGLTSCLEFQDPARSRPVQSASAGHGQARC